MKGTILDFSIQKSEGIISADDNQHYTFVASKWRSSEMPLRGGRVDFEPAGSVANAIYLAIDSPPELDKRKTFQGSFSPIVPYYQEEFQKILDSEESYKGKWNWAAFFFVPFWAIYHNAWKSAITCLVISVVSYGVGGFVFAFIYGIKGNYIYYNLHVKNKQIFGWE
jgi:hypothetical protein